MEKYITATEANQNLSRVLRDVAAGTTYTVTSRGKPVAEIVPPQKKQLTGDWQDLWDEFDKLPRLVAGPWTRDELYDRNS